MFLQISHHGKKAVIERNVVPGIEAAQRRRFDEELRKLQAMSEGERMIRIKRRQVESLLELKCPECGQVFNEIEQGDCMTVKCSVCGTAFCAWCLENCKEPNNNAHPHVLHCPYKPPGAPNFYDNSPGRRDWKRFTAKRQSNEEANELRQIEDPDLRKNVLFEVVGLLKSRDLWEMFYRIAIQMHELAGFLEEANEIQN